MAKLLKIISLSVGAILLLILLLALLLVTVISPNRLKPFLVEKVKQETGRELSLDGDLSWTFFPNFGVKTGHVSLGNPKEFTQKTFAEFENVTLSVQVIPLLHRTIKFNGIVLKGIKLNLIKNTYGQTNWVFKSNKASQTSYADQSDSSRASNKNKFNLNLSSIDITDGSVRWVDEKNNKNLSINHLDFHAKDIDFTKSFPVSGQFDFDLKNPNMSGKVELNSQLALNMGKQLYTLQDIDLVLKEIQKNKKIETNLTGDLTLDLNKGVLQWTHFKMKLDELVAMGNINASNLMTIPSVSAHFDIPPFNLKSVMQHIGKDVSKLQTIKNVQGKINLSGPLKTMVATGAIKIDGLEAQRMKLNNINMRLKFQEGVLLISPISANLYSGQLNANTTVNLKGNLPKIQTNGKLVNIQVAPLLQDMNVSNKKLSLTGLANADFNVSTIGSDGSTITRNLNGSARFILTNGVLAGMDLGYYIDTAYALANQKPTSAVNLEKTTFGTLTATAIIRNGVISNNDLLLNAPRFNAKGQGTLNLVNQTIDYSLQAVLKENKVSTIKNFSGLTVPIRLTGALSHPTVRLDTEALLKAVASQQIEKHKEKIQQKIQEKIQEQLPGNTGVILNTILGQ